MKNKIVSLFLAFVMAFSVAVPLISAADFQDAENHWARDYIDRAVELGFFQGVSDTEFDPNGTMTRGMFVTVLGRLEGIDPAMWTADKVPQLFKDVKDTDYYAPYISWAAYCGIVNGMGGGLFMPDVPVTREQMAKLVDYYIQCMGHGLRASEGEVPESFADSGSIASWALSSVEVLKATGILNGSPNADGSVSFLPQNTSTRAEGAAVFCRLSDALMIDEVTAAPEELVLNAEEVSLELGERFTLTATLLPEGCTTVPLFWHSSDESCFTVSETGLVSCVGVGTSVVSVYTSDGLSASCVFHCNTGLASADETYEQKCIRVFGEVVSDPRLYYAKLDENGNYIYGSNGIPEMDYERAAADMVTVTVQVWDLNSKGEKVTKTMSFKAHKNLAATFQQIFKEIYEGEELFPIHYLGGTSRGGRSEHTIGTAVDINPNENYYCGPDGSAIVGSYWKPGEDPYSIPLDGEVVAIFAKYGFTQGIYWRSGYKDYMHFSYFAT